MLNQVQGSDYAYTSKGNVYKKSTTGKKIGAVAVPSALAAGIVGASMDRNYREKQLWELLEKKGLGKKFLKEIFEGTGENLAEVLRAPLEYLTTNRENSTIGRFVRKLPMSVSSAVGLAVLAGLGALIGHGFDKVAEIPAKIKANVTADKTEK